MKLLMVTGGSRGLGKAIVEHYAGNNTWRVVELSRSGKSEHHIECDLSDVNSVEALSGTLFSQLASKHWDEIVYINNAGDLHPIAAISSLKASDIITNVSLNQISAFILISGFISAFRNCAVSKTLVNISSGAALKGYAGWSMYCASKAACENFINTTAVEEALQPHPFVAVNYDPSVMDTAMQAAIRNSDPKHFPAKPRFIDFKESGKLRTPDVVAADLLEKVAKGMVNNTRYCVA